MAYPEVRPRFSVIIPLYNKEAYVTKAVKSVLAQTFTDYELVIVDDGSKDASGKIAAKAIEGHNNCRLITQANAGVSVARNNGVAQSSGKYLCFLDADDWWSPTFLEEMDALIEEFPDAGIYGTNYTIVNETKRKTRVAPVGVDSAFEKGYINYCQVYAKTLCMPLTSITVAVPRHVFEEMRGFPKGIKLGEDFMLWISIALKYKVAFLNKPLAFYNQDADSAGRAVDKLHNPKEHMLWNLSQYEDEERQNTDYKALIDKLRVYCLLPYYVSRKYHECAAREIDKVDWSGQPESAFEKYHQPLLWIRTEYVFRKYGAKAKTRLKNL